MNTISSRILTTLKDCGIRPEDRILAAISGGLDSVFLLSQLHHLGQTVTAAVFDHGLRPEAAEECRFVMSLCSEMGITCLHGKADVSEFAEQQGIGIEEAARILRYRFLFESAAGCGAAAVATAHHANDQAETVLLHLLRGSGIDGLGGIRLRTCPNAFSETIPLIRPLLGITREEIFSAASEAGLKWREDRSNEDLTYTRNRIRSDLLPKLEADYNPQIVQALCRLAETAAADREILDKECEDILRYAAFRIIDSDAVWSRKVYRQAPEGLRLRMLRKCLSHIKIDQPDITLQNLKEADKFFMQARCNQTIPFIRGIWLRCEGDLAKILKDIKKIQWKYPQFSDGWELDCETREISEKELPEWIEKARLHPEMAILDAYQVAEWPYLRRIRPGERFTPYGLCGRSQKLSDFLINSRIPKEYRGDLAVAADTESIIWIPGMRVNNRCALGNSTRHLMILRLKKCGG